MFLYYDKNGILKRQVIDTPFRVGNVNSNTIYVYLDGWKDAGVYSATVTFKYVNEDSSVVSYPMNMSDSDFTEGEFLLSSLEIGEVATDIAPFKWDYDYFANRDSHEGLLLKYVVDSALIQNGSCMASIKVDYTTSDSTKVSFSLGYFSFYVEDSAVYTTSDGLLEAAISNYIDLLNEKVAALEEKIADLQSQIDDLK